MERIPLRLRKLTHNIRGTRNSPGDEGTPAGLGEITHPLSYNGLLC